MQMVFFLSLSWTEKKADDKFNDSSDCIVFLLQSNRIKMEMDTCRTLRTMGWRTKALSQLSAVSLIPYLIALY